jgi:predicted hydrolase (HD superfamily)
MDFRSVPLVTIRRWQSGKAEELGVSLDEHIAYCIDAMRVRSAELGL